MTVCRDMDHGEPCLSTTEFAVCAVLRCSSTFLSASSHSSLSHQSPAAFRVSLGPLTTLRSIPQEIAEKAADAYRIAEMDDSMLLVQMSGSHPARPVSMAAVLALRVACMRLLTVMMAWEPFR